MIGNAGRVFSVVVGLLLLWAVTAHRNPWDPLWVTRAIETLGLDMRTLALALWALVGSISVGATLVAARRFGLSRRRHAIALAVVALVMVTLIPGGARACAVVVVLFVGTIGVALIACALAQRSTLERCAHCIERWSSSWARIPASRFAAAAALVVLAGSAAACHFLLGRIPHVVDGAAALFHAKMLLAGHAWVPAPEPADSFRFTHMVMADGRWYSQYPPGQLVLLAAGLVARAPWLVNPLLGAATAVLVYLLTREIHDERTARLAAVLWALSPFVWLISASCLSHAPAALLLTLFLLGFARALAKGGTVAAVVAGLALGAAACVRPFTAAAFALPCAIWALARVLGQVSSGDRRGATRQLANGVVMGASVALLLVALAGFNTATTGDPLEFGYEAAHGRDALPGLGAKGWWDRPHTAWLGLVATFDNLNALNRFLFGLAWPSLLLPLAGLVLGRAHSWNRCLAACFASLAAGYFFYWYHDWAYGPRFFYEATPVLVVLSAVALRRLHDGFQSGSERLRLAAAAGWTVLAISFLHAWLVNVPVLAMFYGRNYADGNAAVARAVRQGASPGSVLLVPGLYYPSVFPLNEPTLDGPVVYARDEGPSSARALASRFPGRRLYRLRSLARYVVQAYDPAADSGALIWVVEPGEPLVFETLSFQVSHLRAERAANRTTSELGGGWRNHDELRVSSSAAGAEVGFIFEASRPETRRLEFALSRSPTSGKVEFSWNGRSLEPQVDLWSREARPVLVQFEGVPVDAGRNGLLLRVVGRNEASTGYEMGLDWLSLTP